MYFIIGAYIGIVLSCIHVVTVLFSEKYRKLLERFFRDVGIGVYEAINDLNLDNGVQEVIFTWCLLLLCLACNVIGIILLFTMLWAVALPGSIMGVIHYIRLR